MHSIVEDIVSIARGQEIIDNLDHFEWWVSLDLQRGDSWILRFNKPAQAKFFSAYRAQQEDRAVIEAHLRESGADQFATPAQ